MNIHAAYNVFDNEELLEDSIKSIRNFASEITVVYQKISNHGNKCEDSLEDVIFSLREKKLVDNIILYNPKLSIQPGINELRKNNIGYMIAKQKKFDYHMCMNCDEFYFENDTKKILEILKEYEVDLVTSYMYTYYKTTKYRFKEVENYVVGVANKVYQDREYTLGGPYPILMDPTRSMPYNSCFCLPKLKPIMHHLSHVRKNYLSKLLNSSAKFNWADKIPEMIKYYNNWKAGDDAYVFGKFEKLEFTDVFKQEIMF